MSTHTRTNFSQKITEGQSALFSAVLREPTGEIIPGSALNSARLTLLALRPKPPVIINGIEDVDILNTGRGTIDENGVVRVALLPEDTAMLDTTKKHEDRVAQIVFTWNDGAGRLPHEWGFTLEGLEWAG